MTRLLTQHTGAQQGHVSACVTFLLCSQVGVWHVVGCFAQQHSCLFFYLNPHGLPKSPEGHFIVLDNTWIIPTWLPHKWNVFLMGLFFVRVWWIHLELNLILALTALCSCSTVGSWHSLTSHESAPAQALLSTFTPCYLLCLLCMQLSPSTSLPR